MTKLINDIPCVKLPTILFDHSFAGGVSLTINQQSGKLDTQVCKTFSSSNLDYLDDNSGDDK